MQNEEDKKSSVEAEVNAAKNDSIVDRVVDRVKDADSILVTLSRDPSVDEMAAAIGLTLMLDRMDKHATAIYSGKTPNALEFLEPKKTFETNTNSLQDFIIALNKDKADHLRYKIEDEFVKVYITPYRTTIDEQDLQFSHGDINVDLVISLNVKDMGDLDAALSKHGRIMHDASAINISNDVPGKLGGIEWDDPKASSVSEMIVRMIEALGQDIPEEVATALLTGVVAATERFSNDKTTPETMAVSAKLMESGANQQLIAVNIEKQDAPEKKPAEEEAAKEGSLEGTILDISRDKKEESAGTNTQATEEQISGEQTPAGQTSDEQTASPEQQLEQMVSGLNPSPTEGVGGQPATNGAVIGQPLMDELAATVPDVASTPEVAPVPEPVQTPEVAQTPEEALKQTIPDVASEPEVEPVVTPSAMPETTGAPVIEAPASMAEAAVPKVEIPTTETTQLFGEQHEPSVIDRQVVIPSAQGEDEAKVAAAKMPAGGIYETADDMTHLQDKTVEPIPEEMPKDYGEMMEKELANTQSSPFATNPAISAAPNVAAQPEVQPVTEPMVGTDNVELPQAPAPQVPGVEAPLGQSIGTVGQAMDAALPPVQPVVMQGDESAANGVPAAPEGAGVEAPKEELNPVIIQPEPAQDAPKEPVPEPAQEPVRDPASVPPVADPGAFKIPGM